MAPVLPLLPDAPAGMTICFIYTDKVDYFPCKALDWVVRCAKYNRWLYIRMIAPKI